MASWWMLRVRRALLAGLCLPMACWGCATIRKFNPVGSDLAAARQLTRQAQADIHDERWDAAETNLLNAIDRCPDDDTARCCLADVLWNRGANRAAIEQLSKAIELSGRNDPAMLTRLGRMELTEGDFTGALQRAEEALNSDSTYADAWLLRGRVLAKQGDASSALACYFRSLSIHDDNPQTRVEIADIYRSLGQPRRALAVLDAAARAGRPDCDVEPQICYLRGLVLRDLDRPGDAANSLAKAYQHGLSSPELRFELADAQLAAGDLFQARSTATEALANCRPEQQSTWRELLRRIDVVQRQLSVHKLR